MLIQYFLILLILVILYRIFSKWRQGSLDLKAFVFWLCFWVLAGAVVFRPESTNFVANIFGVGRGADLVIYLSIIVIFYIIFQTAVKIERMERNITKIVREVAIKQTTDDLRQTTNEGINGGGRQDGRGDDKKIASC